MSKKKIILMILMIITILQISIRIYIGNDKNYYHMDEAYSYGLINYERLNITDNPDFSNKWHDKQYYLDYLEINQDEKNNWIPVYENQKNDVHPPLYYLMLRIVSNFSIDNFTKWTGIILNIIFFVCSNYFIYQISKIIFKNPIYGIFACIINGLSLISLNSSSYIRMYELANLMTLILTWGHIRIWKKEKIKWKDCILISVAFILGGLTHYYVLLYGLGIYLVYTWKCWRAKQYNSLKKYQISVACSGILYLCIFPYAIEHIFFSYRGMNNTGKPNWILQISGYLQILNKEIFHYLAIPFIIILIFLYKKNRNKNSKENILYLLIIPIILYLCIVISKAPYIEVRYIMPIYSSIIIAILYIAKNIIQKGRKQKETLFILAFLYAIMLYSPMVTKVKLDFIYKQYQPVVQKIETENKPIVYLFNPQENRFLDDIYLFTLTDKSIILEGENGNKILKEIIEQKQNFILIGSDKEIEKWKDKLNLEWIENMNAVKVFKTTF